MIKQNLTPSNPRYKFAYFGMIGLSILSLALEDFALSACMVALSIIFYPFDVKTSWPNKTIAQKSFILGHLLIAILIALIALYEGGAINI